MKALIVSWSYARFLARVRNLKLRHRDCVLVDEFDKIRGMVVTTENVFIEEGAERLTEWPQIKAFIDACMARAVIPPKTETVSATSHDSK